MEKNDNQKLVYYKEHPLCLYVTNKVQSTKTLLLCSRDVKNIINKITSVSENPKKCWIDKKENKIDFTITEEEHSSWWLSMHINYDITNNKLVCDGYDDKSMSEIRKTKKYIDWDKETIHIYNGNTFKK